MAYMTFEEAKTLIETAYKNDLLWRLSDAIDAVSCGFTIGCLDAGGERVDFTDIASKELKDMAYELARAGDVNFGGKLRR